MKRLKYLVHASALILLLSQGCRNSSDPIMDVVPYIEIQSLSTTSVVQFVDSVDLILYYEDGDGDLGHPDPDSLQLEVKDSRLTNADRYHIQPVSPPDTKLPVRGTIKVTLSSTFLLGNGTEEVIRYSIRLKDYAGNWSNTALTDNITITKE